MDVSDPAVCTEDMVQLRDEDGAPPPAKKWRRKETVVSLTHTPVKKGLHPLQSHVETPPVSPHLMSDGQGEMTAPSRPDGGDQASTGEGFPAPPSGTVHGGQTHAAPPDPSSVGDDLLAPPVKVPKKRGRKSKAELAAMKALEKKEEPEETVAVPVEAELTPGGRPRRRAAAVALRYLHEIAEEWSPSMAEESNPEKKTDPVPRPRPPAPGKKGRKRKSRDSDDDVDFVVSEDLLREEETEEADNDCLSDQSEDDPPSYSMNVFSFGEKPHPQMRGLADNGFHNSIMIPVLKSAEITMEFRDHHHSDWEFPEWIPCKDRWHFMSCRDAEPYVPLQLSSVPFTIRREGIGEEAEPCVLGRFQSLPPHPERLDSTFFAGGPVWSMEWCPTPAGSGASQHLAVYCHRGMDDRNNLQVTHSRPALIQIWRLGELGAESGGESPASFSYGLAVDEGCVWDMKFCPSGGWELPSTPRQGSKMARLGLLAAAFSSGHVEIYSLPHPESLQAHRKSQVKDTSELTICKADAVIQLYVGSIKACHPGDNGQCFSLAWLHAKPHQYLAAGFYDGTVAVWDLHTKSVLQRLRVPGHVIRQYPFLSFPAHDHAVRCIEWCKGDGNIIVTCGADRNLKFWDLRRLATPINIFKRFQCTEVTWLLPYCGVVVAQDNCFAAFGLCGLHYVDSGFMGHKPFFAAPRRGTAWSVSGSDWLGTITAGDITGEVIAVLMPFLNVQSINTKRPSDRRFPVYKADLLFSTTPVDGDTQSTPGAAPREISHQDFKPKSYRASANRASLLFQDTDMRDFHRIHSREPTRRMQANETKGNVNLERVQLESIHRVRFSPNLDAYTWMASAGHSGLVRVHCVRGLASSPGKEMIQEKTSQFLAANGTRDCNSEGPLQP